MSESRKLRQYTSNIVTVTLNGQVDSARSISCHDCLRQISWSGQACGEGLPSLVGKEKSTFCGWMSSSVMVLGIQKEVLTFVAQHKKQKSSLISR